MKKSFTIKIKVNDKKIRNEMHFNAQLKNPLKIQENKKKYKRSRAKDKLRKEEY